jgi:ATP-dependent Lon protease
VLPIGGLKEKALAAQRAGIARVIAPALNEADADDIPAHLRAEIEFIWVSHIDDVVAAALEAARVTELPRARRHRSSPERRAARAR